MIKKAIIVSFLFFYLINTYAQSKLNAYKYVIVPKRYSFFKEDDKYRLNALTKFLFEKQGFKTVWQDDQYPEDLLDDPCLGLQAGLKNNSNMFTTKLILTLTDCRNQVVFESEEGRSKEKEFKKSYHEALRRTFISLQKEQYRYEPGKQDVRKGAVMAEKEAAVYPSDHQAEKAKAPVKTPAPPVAVKPVQPAKKNINVARSYRGDKFSFFLIEQSDGFVIYVNESKDPKYKKGEQIGTLSKTSLPNVFRINWKVDAGKFQDSTAYFDEAGNLKIDVKENGKIRVKEFKREQ